MVDDKRNNTQFISFTNDKMSGILSDPSRGPNGLLMSFFKYGAACMNQVFAVVRSSTNYTSLTALPGGTMTKYNQGSGHSSINSLIHFHL